MCVCAAVYPNKDTYSGAFKSLKKNGKGVYSFHSSEKAQYTGDFVNDKKHGQGQFVYPDESKYIGMGTHYYDDIYCVCACVFAMCVVTNALCD